MRVVIDIQACQRAYPQQAYDQRLLLWLSRLLQDLQQHDVVLLASRALEADTPTLQAELLALAPNRERLSWLVFEAMGPSAARWSGRAWPRRATELLREHCLASVQADVVLVLQPWAGWDSNAVFSLSGLDEFPTWVVVPPQEVLAVRPVGRSAAVAAYGLWEQEIWRAVRKADRVLLWGDVGAAQAHHSDLAGLLVDSLGASVEEASAVLQAALQGLPDRCSGTGQTLQPARVVADKPKLAYVSPLPPMASGIADYSAELIPALARYYELELVVDTTTPLELPWGDLYPIRSLAWFSEHAASYDRILYHFGNSSFHGHMVELLRHYPGTVVLHDFYLGHLFGSVHHSGKVPAALRRALFQSHGVQALYDWREQGEAAALAKYPCSFEVFAQADGVILHSAHAEALAQQWYGPELPCVMQRVPLAHASPPLETLPALREQARRALGLAAGDVLVCSFGYAGAGKRSLELVQAWQQTALASQPKYRLVLVGGHQMDGPARDALEAELRKPEAAHVTLTGYVSPETYRHYLAAADLAVQLRADSRGETSRAVLDAFAHGVPLIVNAHGSAAELPQSAVVMLTEQCSTSEIAAALTNCLENRAERERLAGNGNEHVREIHAPEQVAPLYREAIELAARQGRRSAAGRGRAVVRTLAQEARQWGWPPSAAEVARLARLLARQAGGRSARPVLPDTTALLRPGQGRSGQPLRLLMVTDAPAVAEARKTELQQRREAMCLAYADMGMVVEHCYGASLSELLEQLTEKANTLPDVIQIDLLETWLQLQPSWNLLGQTARGRAAKPGLIYDAWWQDKLQSAPGYELSVAQAEALQELAQAADLLWSASDVSAATWIGRRERGAGVHIVPAAGTLPTADFALTTAVYRDHLPQSPYALVLADGHSQQVEDFLYFLGESLAYLPPDTILLVVGELGRELEQDSRFLRWRGINHSRCRFIVDPDALGMASLRRHAALVVLPRRSRLGETLALTVTADTLLDRVPILATSAALLGHEAVAAAVGVLIEDTPSGFRRRLAQCLAQLRVRARTVEELEAASTTTNEGQSTSAAVSALFNVDNGGEADGWPLGVAQDLAAVRWEAVLVEVAREVQQLAQGCRQRGGVAEL